MRHSERQQTSLGFLLSGGIGVVYFLAFLLCLNQIFAATEQSRPMSFFGRVLITEAALGGVVFGLVRLTPFLKDPSAPKTIIFVAMALSTLFGLYWGALMAGVLTGIAGAFFASPCLLPILFGTRANPD